MNGEYERMLNHVVKYCLRFCTERLRKITKIQHSLCAGRYRSRTLRNTKQHRYTLENDFRLSFSDYLQYKGNEMSVLRRGSTRAISSVRPLMKCRLGTGLSRVSSGGVGWDDGFPTTAQN